MDKALWTKYRVYEIYKLNSKVKALPRSLLSTQTPHHMLIYCNCLTLFYITLILIMPFMAAFTYHSIGNDISTMATMHSHVQ